MPGVSLRPVTAADAEALGRLHVDVWRATYRGLMSDAALAALDVDQRAGMWRNWLSSSNAPETIGAFDGDELVGWITVCDARDDDAPATRELAVLNVAPAQHGRGVAQALLQRVLGDERAYLWVVEGNDRAIAFYRKHGFELDGAARDENEGNRDLRMVRVPTPSSD